jgi:hypothetical protein
LPHRENTAETSKNAALIDNNLAIHQPILAAVFIIIVVAVEYLAVAVPCTETIFYAALKMEFIRGDNVNALHIGFFNLNHRRSTERQTGMDSDFLPNGDDELVRWATQFVTMATANISAVGLTSQQITDFSNMSSTFNIRLQNVDTKRGEYQGAVEAKDAQRKLVVNTAREYNRIVQSKTTATPEIKAKLGLKVRRKGEKTPPIAPAKLTVTGNSLGENFLEWSRNGNISGTVYEIFFQTDGAGDWTFLTSTNAVKYTHQSAVPGQMTAYKVRARRRDVYSVFSEEAVIYAAGEAAPVTLKLAA